MSAEQASYWLWSIWYVTWWIPALWSAKPSARPGRGTSNLDRALAFAGVILLFPVPVRAAGRFALLAPIWSEPPWTQWLLVACIVAAFAFCWWARVHLGRLWSGLVTTKADHRIVDTGPYRLVRHPIYSGVITAAVCVGLIKASPAALLGAVLVAAGFWMTARKEEAFLRQELGSSTYDDYSRRTAMLAPFLHYTRSPSGCRRAWPSTPSL